MHTRPIHTQNPRCTSDLWFGLVWFGLVHFPPQSTAEPKTKKYQENTSHHITSIGSQLNKHTQKNTHARARVHTHTHTRKYARNTFTFPACWKLTSFCEVIARPPHKKEKETPRTPTSAHARRTHAHLRRLYGRQHGLRHPLAAAHAAWHEAHVGKRGLAVMVRHVEVRARPDRPQRHRRLRTLRSDLDQTRPGGTDGTA